MATDSGPVHTTTQNMDNGMEKISPKNTDHGKTTTTSRIMDNGKTQQQTKNADIGRETTTRRITDYGTKALYQSKTQTFEKKLTVAVEIIGEENVSMMELLKEIKKICGVVIGCRFKGQKKYEITMEKVDGKEKLLDGLKIKDNLVFVKEMVNNELVVSFLNLPTYVPDEVILVKLHEWGVKAVSPIKRRMWPGTDIADGTRFLRVQFTETVKSLPYSAKFDTLEGTEFFRVIHDRQVRVWWWTRIWTRIWTRMRWRMRRRMRRRQQRRWWWRRRQQKWSHSAALWTTSSCQRIHQPGELLGWE